MLAACWTFRRRSRNVWPRGALERFAVAYADQNDADYAAFTEAADGGRIEIQSGL